MFQQPQSGGGAHVCKTKSMPAIAGHAQYYNCLLSYLLNINRPVPSKSSFRTFQVFWTKAISLILKYWYNCCSPAEIIEDPQPIIIFLIEDYVITSNKFWNICYFQPGTILRQYSLHDTSLDINQEKHKEIMHLWAYWCFAKILIIVLIRDRIT